MPRSASVTMAGLNPQGTSSRPEDYKVTEPSNPVLSEFHHIPLMWISHKPK